MRRRRRAQAAFTWDESRLRLAIVSLVAVKVAGLVLIFDVTRTLLQSFDLAKSAFSRATEAAIFVCVVIALVRFGPKIVPSARVAVAAAGVLAVNLAATAVAANPYLALFGEQDRFLGITFLVDMFVLMFGTMIAFRTSRDWAIAGAALGFAALVAAGYAVVQVTGHDPIRWAQDSRERPFSTFGNADMFGEFLSVAIAVSFAVIVLETRVNVRAAALLILLATASVAVVTASRGTAMAVAAALLALPIVVFRVYGWDRATLRRLGAVVVVALFAFVVVLAITPLGVRVRGTFTGDALTLDRVLLFEAAGRAFAARPVLGWGPDNFGVAYPLYRQVEVVRQLGVSLPSNSAHSWLLQTAVTTGALGILALGTVIAIAGERVWSSLRRSPTVGAAVFLGSVAYWTHALVTVGTVSVDWFPWAAFGAAAALGSTPTKVVTGSHWPAWTRTLPLILGLLIAWEETSALSASAAARVATVALNVDAGDVALSEAQAAVFSDDGRADYWNTLGRAYSAVQRWRESSGAFIEATKRSPHNSLYWMNLAKTRAQQTLAGDTSGGGKASAIAAARAGIAADPSIPEPLIVLGDVAYALGEYDVSLDAADALIRMLPQSTAYDGYAARAAIAVPDAASARAKLEAILALRESALLHLATAQVAVKQNDLVTARTHARRALQLEPANAGAQRLLTTIGE